MKVHGVVKSVEGNGLGSVDMIGTAHRRTKSCREGMAEENRVEKVAVSA